MSKFYAIPFANAGDKTTIPEVDPGDNSVNYTEGYTPDYELEQGVAPGAKDIPRDKENQFKFDITVFAGLVQESGVMVYEAVFDYLVGAHVQASNGFIYRASAINGPSSSVVNPLTDLTGVWESLSADVQMWLSGKVYPVGSYVKGADNILYRASVINGTGTGAGIVDPDNGSGFSVWTPVKSDVATYSSGFNYRTGDYVKGVDTRLYRALSVNGPDTTPADPTDVDVWELISTPATTFSTTTFTSNGTFNPGARVKTIRFTVTGGGGGGGGVNADGDTTKGAGAPGGGAGGTAIKTISAPFDSSYTITIGAGGSAGIGATNTSGGDGGLSSVVATSPALTVEGLGGDGGPSPSVQSSPFFLAGEPGGIATGGDINLGGGGSDATISHLTSGSVVSVTQASSGGNSFYGGGARGSGANGAGFNGAALGAGGGGAAVSQDTTDRDGGAGEPGVVMVEEFF